MAAKDTSPISNQPIRVAAFIIAAEAGHNGVYRSSINLYK